MGAGSPQVDLDGMQRVCLSFGTMVRTLLSQTNDIEQIFSTFLKNGSGKKQCSVQSPIVPRKYPCSSRLYTVKTRQKADHNP